MEVLITVRDVSDELGTQCWVGAGVIRDLVWDTRYGRSRDRSPANFDGASAKDIDVVFFDPADLDPSRDTRAEAAPSGGPPGVTSTRQRRSAASRARSTNSSGGS
jgi:uncharacterized protein